MQISALTINWPDITNNPADFVLTFSASVNLSQLKGAPLALSGSVTDIVIDVGKLVDLKFPIISIGGVTVSVSGNLFGGTISATLLAGIVRFDSEGYEVDQNNLRIGSGTTAVGTVTGAFYAGIRGSFSLGGLSGFKLSLGLSEFGPLTAYVAVSLPTGILLEPTSGLTINNLRGGVDFNQTLPSSPILTRARQRMPCSFGKVRSTLHWKRRMPSGRPICGTRSATSSWQSSPPVRMATLIRISGMCSHSP